MKGQILTLFGLEEIQEQPPAKPREEKKKKSKGSPADIIPDVENGDGKTAPQHEEITACDEDEVVNNDNVIPTDWEGEKKYYTIGEVAVFFNVKTSNIRFWTNEFKIKVRTNRKGDRMYTPNQVRELRTIYHLVKERGFTLAGAKTKLAGAKNRDVEMIDLKDSLQSLKNKLIIIRSKLG